MERRDFLKYAALIPVLPVFPKMMKPESFSAPFVDVPEVPDDWDRFKTYCQKNRIINWHGRLMAYVPGEWLRPVFDAYQTHARVMFKKYRQGGFSTFSRDYASWRAEEFGEQWLYVGESWLHTSYSIEAFHSDGLVYATQKLEFPQGFQLENANIMIDEAAWLKNGGIGGVPGPKIVGDDPWPMARKVFAFSVPKKRSGWFYHVYHHALVGNNPYHVVPTHYSQCPNWSPEKVKHFYESAGEACFNQEVLGQWPMG